jgi:energy-coupling factor transporter ATP-binding protein EcfA2
MLLEFRVRNFRSIRDEQSLTLTASSDTEFARTHLSPTGLKAAPNALRTVVLYGPNASGKSSVLRALDYLRAVVAESATVIQPGQTYNVQPFKLDTATVDQPTEFEITFLLSGVRHQYAFSMTAQRIVTESLLAYRSSKPTQLFSRRHTGGDHYNYEFSAHLTGPRKLWQESTRPNALFLSMAAQLNSEPLSPVFNWIGRHITFLPAGATVLPDFTTALLATEPGRTSIREFLSAADLSIADIQAVPRKGVQAQWVMGASGLQASQEEREFLVPVFEHSTPKGSAKFELHDESDGTQRLYGLIAPVLDCLREGRVLVVDELDSSLHTLLVRRLINMFHTPELNPKGAQLIFSTHDTALLDNALFRRDQIWFAEKDADQATRLYPLTDFSPRKQEALERGYLAGRYGAVPFFSSMQSHTNAEVH